MSVEHDKLIIKTLRTAIVVAWLVVVSMVASIVVNATRSCPKCPACSGPAEKP